jgi:phosphate starvation-inducible membrane PsiE
MTRTWVIFAAVVTGVIALQKTTHPTSPGKFLVAVAALVIVLAYFILVTEISRKKLKKTMQKRRK